MTLHRGARRFEVEDDLACWKDIKNGRELFQAFSEVGGGGRVKAW